jgi:hypothetical protein
MPKVQINLEDFEGELKINVLSDTKVDENTTITPALYLGGELMKRLKELHEEQPVVDAEIVADEVVPPSPAPDANNG